MALIQTTRPISNLVGQTNGITVVGAYPNSWAALASNVDTNYVTMQPKSNLPLNIELPTLTGTAGTKLAQIRFRVRLRRYWPLAAASVPNPYVRLLLDGDGNVPTLDRPRQIDMETTIQVPGRGIVTINPPGSYPMRGVPMKALPSVFLRVTLTRTDRVPSGYAATDPESLLYVYAVYVDTVFVDRPTVRVRAPIPDSTITTDNTPRVAYIPSFDPEGGPQTFFQVKIFDWTPPPAGFDPNSATPVPYGNSGAIVGAGRYWDVPDSLDDDTYRAYVRAAQTIGDGTVWWSDWTDTSLDPPPWSQWVQATTRPGFPTITATPQNTQGRNLLTITRGTGALSTDYYQLQSSRDGGVTYDWMRTPYQYGFYPSQGATTYVADYECLNGNPMRYRCRAVSHTPGVVPAVDQYGANNVYSLWTNYAAATWSSPDWWLKHPFNRPLSIFITPKSQPGRQRAARQGIFQPLGRSDPIVISDTPGPFQGELVVRCDSDDERNRLSALIAEGTPILIQAPTSTQDWPDTWVIIGDQRRDRLIDAAWSKITYETLQWTQVKAPIGKLWFE